MQGLIPKGVSISLPEAQEGLELVRSRVEDVFSRWGFREVGTPIFEYYDDVYKGIDESLEGALVKLIERETGRIIVLRPDFTPQVARIAATILRKMPRPLRLFYKGSVFRWLGKTTSYSKQIKQIGLEIIGLDKPEACAELIAISEEVLEGLGIQRYTIVLSNVSFIRELLSAFDPGMRKRIAFALARKDKKELEAYISGADSSLKRLIMVLPDLVVGPDGLGEIKRVFAGSGLEGYLDELEAVVRVLREYGLLKNILIDLSEIRGMTYHKGFFFEVFVEGVGKRVAVGGRYDDLMRAYGSEEPGMGFAFNLEALYRAALLEGNSFRGRPVDVLIVDTSEVKDRGVALAALLRREGFRVARDIIERDLSASVEYAKIHGIRRVVVVSDELKKRGYLLVMDVFEGTSMEVPESDILSHLREA